MIYLLLLTLSLAADIPGEEIFSAPLKPEVTSEAAQDKPSNKKQRVQVIHEAEKGNLPKVYKIMSNRQSTNSELLIPSKGSVEVFRGLRVGDSLDLYVDHSVIAFPDEKSPVVAAVQNGPHRGLRFVGESYLEPNSRRIFINFNRLINGDHIFTIKGIAVSDKGQPGLSGEYHSREAEYFAGDFISSFVAGYFDGLVPRRTNAFGQIETDPSVDTAVKKGLSSGALSTAERFREKLKKVPEFSEIKGPFKLKILILDQAKSTN